MQDFQEPPRLPHSSGAATKKSNGRELAAGYARRKKDGSNISVFFAICWLKTIPFDGKSGTNTNYLACGIICNAFRGRIYINEVVDQIRGYRTGNLPLGAERARGGSLHEERMRNQDLRLLRRWHEYGCGFRHGANRRRRADGAFRARV
jgi:hypothetical protein